MVKFKYKAEVIYTLICIIIALPLSNVIPDSIIYDNTEVETLAEGYYGWDIDYSRNNTAMLARHIYGNESRPAFLLLNGTDLNILNDTGYFEPYGQYEQARIRQRYDGSLVIEYKQNLSKTETLVIKSFIAFFIPFGGLMILLAIPFIPGIIIQGMYNIFARFRKIPIVKPGTKKCAKVYFEHQVTQILNESRIKARNLQRTLPPKKHKILRLHIPYYKEEYQKLRWWHKFKDYYTPQFYRKNEFRLAHGLNALELATPNDFDVQEGDIISFEGTVKLIKRDQAAAVGVKK